jgi:hypothetical protein
MKRKTTSIKVDEDLWKRFKIKSIEKDKEISVYLEELIKKELK